MINNKIKELRLQTGLTQETLTSTFNSYIDENNLAVKKISYATLSRWESGVNAPNSDAVDIFSKIFDVDVLYILGYQEEAKSVYTVVSENLKDLDFLNINTEKENIVAINKITKAFNAVTYQFATLDDEISTLKERIKYLENPTYDDGSGDL